MLELSQNYNRYKTRKLLYNILLIFNYIRVYLIHNEVYLPLAGR